MNIEKLSHKAIGAAIEVHRSLGPGLLESAYQQCLNHELRKSGIFTELERPMPITCKSIELDHGYRLDLKTVEALTDVHTAQLLTYLKLGNYKLGLLINFHVTMLKHGIKRFIY